MKSIFNGMTVNERLYVSNLLEKFDKAVEQKNIDDLTEIFKEIDITDDKTITLILKELNLI